MENLDNHQAYCLSHAIYFTAIRGRNPISRIRREFPSLDEACAYGASFGDGRTMIYAVTKRNSHDHIMNA